MNKNYLIAIVVVIIFVAGFYFLYHGKGDTNVYTGELAKKSLEEKMRVSEQATKKQNTNSVPSRPIDTKSPPPAGNQGRVGFTVTDVAASLEYIQ